MKKNDQKNSKKNSKKNSFVEDRSALDNEEERPEELDSAMLANVLCCQVTGAQISLGLTIMLKIMLA